MAEKDCAAFSFPEIFNGQVRDYKCGDKKSVLCEKPANLAQIKLKAKSTIEIKEEEDSCSMEVCMEKVFNV